MNNLSSSIILSLAKTFRIHRHTIYKIYREKHKHKRIMLIAKKEKEMEEM